MKKILLVLSFCFLLFACVACDKKEEGVDLSGIKFSGTEVEYDGNEHSIYLVGNLPAGYTVDYFGNKAVVAGKHLVTAVIYDESGKEVKRLTAYIDVLASDYQPPVDVEELVYTISFDGEEYFLEFDDSNEEDSYLQYYVSEIDVFAEQDICVYDTEYEQIYDIHDERKGSSNTNNAFGEGEDMKVLTDATADVYLRVYEDGTYSLWITGNNEEVSGGTSEEDSEVITVYFSNNKFWNGEVKAYIWKNNTEDKPADWPGMNMTYVEKNDFNEDIYSIQVDLSMYDMIIFTNGSEQSIDISLANVLSGTGFYLTDKNNEGKYSFDTYSYGA